MPAHLVFGAGGIGGTAKSFTYSWDSPEKVAELLAVLKKMDVLELDSAASYPPGNPWHTETLLGQSKAASDGFLIDSKVAQHIKGPKLDEKGIESSINHTLELLGASKIRTLYNHAPDPETPLEETAAAFHKQYMAGKFERLGVCNYTTADMAKFFKICEDNSYVKPTVYQGHYNALLRDPENELIPLLRQHNCAFYAYSPLAGGFLTGKVTFATDALSTPSSPPSSDSATLERTRWRGASSFPYYIRMFDRPAMHTALRSLKAACDAASPPVALQEAALRWIVHHSALRDGDGVIFGAKRLDQLQDNVADVRRGPLPEEVRGAVEGLWRMVREGDEGGKL